MRGSYIARLATARPSDGGLQVEQLVAVVDAGRLVNPTIARQQVEGGLISGLAAAVGATTDYEGGVATARKLHHLGLPKLAPSPEMLVEFVDSEREPSCHGAIGLPDDAPPTANTLSGRSCPAQRRLHPSANPPRPPSTLPAAPRQ